MLRVGTRSPGRRDVLVLAGEPGELEARAGVGDDEEPCPCEAGARGPPHHAHDPGNRLVVDRIGSVGPHHASVREQLGERPVGYSHSIVAGGFDERSRATRFTPGTSLMIRFEIVSSTS